MGCGASVAVLPDGGYGASADLLAIIAKGDGVQTSYAPSTNLSEDAVLQSTTIDGVIWGELMRAGFAYLKVVISGFGLLRHPSRLAFLPAQRSPR